MALTVRGVVVRLLNVVLPVAAGPVPGTRSAWTHEAPAGRGVQVESADSGWNSSGFRVCPMRMGNVWEGRPGVSG